MNSKNLVASIFFSVMVPLISSVSLAETVPVKKSNGDAIEELLEINSVATKCKDEKGNDIFCPK